MYRVIKVEQDNIYAKRLLVDGIGIEESDLTAPGFEKMAS